VTADGGVWARITFRGRSRDRSTYCFRVGTNRTLRDNIKLSIRWEWTPSRRLVVRRFRPGLLVEPGGVGRGEGVKPRLIRLSGFAVPPNLDRTEIPIRDSPLVFKLFETISSLQMSIAHRPRRFSNIKAHVVHSTLRIAARRTRILANEQQIAVHRVARAELRFLRILGL
jgi:hypothetical protein